MSLSLRLSRAPLRWVSSTFGLGLAWEVTGCVADEFPVRDGLKVGLQLSCMAKSEEKKSTRQGVARFRSWATGGLGGTACGAGITFGPAPGNGCRAVYNTNTGSADTHATPNNSFPQRFVDLGLAGPSLLSYRLYHKYIECVD